MRIHRAALGVSLQDSGRTGYLRYGVSEAGPMDWARHAMVNQMLARQQGETAIEVGPAGLGLTLESGSLQISFAGPGFIVHYRNRRWSGPRRFILEAGEPLEIIPRAGAMWAYVGVRGRLGIDKVLNSHAENRVGHVYALKLAPGTRLPVIDADILDPGEQAYIDPCIVYETRTIGIMPSSQYADFSPDMRERLVSRPVSIAPRFDRMAYRLQGIRLSCDRGHDILSDAVTVGAIQVPGDGRPFVLMADHQPTGGYPKIGCVCKADLLRVAQMSPGRRFHLRWTSAEQARRQWATLIKQITEITPLRGY